MVTRESEWDDQQRAWMLALAEREDAECRRCGGDLVETTNYDNRYMPLPPLVCLRCLALHQAAEGHRKNPEAQAMIFRVKRADRPKRAKKTGKGKRKG